MEPLVSVIVPIYNVESFLPQCIESILAQTYTNLEILLIDDGSTDKSGAIADSYSDPRIRVFHTENHGLSAARNLGIKNAKGKFISFIDADDWIEPDLLFNAMLQICSADILCFGYNDACFSPGSFSGKDAILAYINGKIPGSVWSKLYRRECFSSLRFPEGRLYEDTAVIYKLLLRANLVICTNICGYHYRNRPGSITNTRNKQNIMDYCKAHMERLLDCIDLVDGEAKRSLHRSCAIAILRAWCWRNSIPELREETVFYEELARFSREHLTSKFLPIHLRIGLCLTRRPSELSFSLANTALRLYRWIKYRKSTP